MGNRITIGKLKVATSRWKCGPYAAGCNETRQVLNWFCGYIATWYYQWQVDSWFPVCMFACVRLPGSVVGRNTMVRGASLLLRIPDKVIEFFTSHTMGLGSTQHLTEISTRNIPGGKGPPARTADNHRTICERIVWKMCEPRRLKTLWD
jgi:hypothetical protein